jgi:hypothetical protein
MPSEFTIDFFGICAFVRNDEWNRVDVVLPKTNRQKTKCQECEHPGVPLHEARLLVNGENLHRPIPSFFDRHVSLPGGHWLSGSLDGYTLTIEGVKPKALIVVRNLRPAKPDPCPNNDSEDISWVSDMKLACGDGRIHPDVLTKNRNVAARIKLSDGSLRCSQLARVGDRIEQFAFDPVGGKKKYQQAFADGVRYMVTLKGAPTLQLTPHQVQGEKTAKSVMLELKTSAGAPVRVAVSHLPAKFTNNPNDHFHAFYDLSAGSPPHNVPEMAGSCTGVAKIPALTNYPKICPSAMFSTDTLDDRTSTIRRGPGLRRRRRVARSPRAVARPVPRTRSSA